MKVLATLLLSLTLAAPSACWAKAKHHPVNGVCETFALSSIPPTGQLCLAGTPTSISGSGPWSWTCMGQQSGSSASCSAPYEAPTPPPPPTLTLTINSPSTTRPNTTPVGTTIAIVTAAWSDGSTFTGTLGFVQPYLDDGGTFALSCTQCPTASLLLSPLGPGFGGDAGTTQYATVGASP